MFIENKEYEPFALEFKRCYKELMKRINNSVAGLSRKGLEW